MSPVDVDYIGEGRSDDAIARRLIEAAGGRAATAYRGARKGSGKQDLDRRLRGLNAGVASGGRLTLVLRDLDQDAVCPLALLANLLPDRQPRLLLRIAVRTAESWLVADAQAYAKYCGLQVGHLPSSPESVFQLKNRMIQSADSDRAPKLARHLADTRQRGVADWAAMGEWHSNFAEGPWNPERAAHSNRSPSLGRALARLRACIREG